MTMRSSRCCWNRSLSKSRRSSTKLRTSRSVPATLPLLSLSPTTCFRTTIWRSSAALRGLISLSPAFCRVLLLTLHPQSNVQSTQEIVELILDANRNALLALDLKISILTMGIGIGTLVVGVFGMNVSRQIRLLFASHVR